MTKSNTYFLKIALLVSAFFVFDQFSFAQGDWLQLLPGSKRLSYDERSGLERLTGTLVFTYQGNIMYCDSAHLKRRTQELWVYSRVQLNKRDSLNLFCDSLYYNGKTRKAKLWGNVRVRDREYKLTTDTLEYDAKSSKAIYRHGGKIENIGTKEVLTSRVGYFYPNTEESFFSGNVVYKSENLKMTTDTLHYNYLIHRVFFKGPTVITQKKPGEIPPKETKMYCSSGWYDVQTEEGVLQKNARIEDEGKFISGDSLYYAPKLKLAIGRGNVILIDTVQKLELRGGFVKSDEINHLDIATDFPLAILKKGSDTLYVRADTLFHHRDSLQKTQRVTGYKDVRMYNRQLQAKADSLVYDKGSLRIDLFGTPYFWSKNSELHGDTVTVYMKNDTIIDKLHLRNNAFAASLVDSTEKYYNQMSGKEIWAYFQKKPKEDHELVKAEIISSASLIYYPEQEKKTDSATIIQRKGLNYLVAGKFVVYLDSGEVKRVSFINQPDGHFYPMNQIEETMKFLKDFSWNPALRPKTWEELLVKFQ